MTFTNPPRNLHRIVTACVWAFTLGCSDGSVGVLLNYIEEQYKISYSVASILWLSNAIGYILVASLASKIQTHLGRKSLVVGCVSSFIMFALVSTGSKYPLIVLGFFFGGVGVGICVSQLNVFVSRLKKSSTGLGYFHGSYGLGASVSPLVATAFVEAGIKWNYFYLILLVLMVVNIANCYYAFAHGEDDLKKWDPPEEVADETNESPNSKSNLMKEALKNRMTWLTSFFVLFYQGGEVAVGGWITTYLRDYRNNKSTSIGYVASGYWFGLTFGRLALTRLIHKAIGARRGNLILGLLAILFVLLTWVIPSLPIEILTITLSGIAIGPVYPLMITYVVSDGLLPRKIQVVSMTITTAFGSSGGAIFPFIVGLISQFAGAYVVLPSFIAMFTTMIILWLLLPNTAYRSGPKGKLDFLKHVW
ncbi:major facilitator superfamily [Scheffersomyces xylosifermentans]|uniref:major facilitator superfamily n=1 Tax=Scheffersomyces xylosifermentans TaxID=1304137 RepID=UPI00315DD083